MPVNNYALRGMGIYTRRLAFACTIFMASTAIFAGEALAFGPLELLKDLYRLPAHEVRLYMDNDLNFSDKYYTAGSKAEFRSFGPAYSYGHGEKTGSALRREIVGITLTQEVYTPENFAPSNIIYGDRPFAGWAYLGFFTEELRADDDSSQKFGVELGCLGSCSRADLAQEDWHFFAGWPYPQGWKNQIDQEFGLVLQYDKRFPKLIDHRFSPGNGVVFDLAPKFHLEAGNIFDRASVGLQMRFGKADAYFNAPAAAHNPTEFYLLLTADGMGVGYNATLQGGMSNKNSPYTVEPSRFVFNGELAAVLNVKEYSAYVGVGMVGLEMLNQPLKLVDHFFWRFQLAYRF